MNVFYILSPKTLAYVYVVGVVVCTLFLLFLAFRIALKADRKRKQDQKKDVTIHITIDDSPSS